MMGDGGEYLAYALNLSHGHAPALTDTSIAKIRADIFPFDPELSRWPIEQAGRRSPDGRQDFVHFWLFPALSAPGVAVLRTLGADPRWSFTLINIALLMAASYVVRRWVGWGAAILLLGGPIVWWSNKVHIEAFIVSLMMIAFALWRDRPGLAMICSGLVAAQVPPFAVFVPMLAIATLVRKRDAWRAPSFLAGLGGGVLLACLPAFYYFARFRTPSLLADVAQSHWPTTTELGTVLWDLNLGLVPNWPLLALAAVVAVASAIAAGRRRLLQPDILMAVAGGVVLMLSFPQVGNPMHGATPGIIRYAVWLTPLAIPVLAAATHAAAHRTIVVIALVSSALSLVHYSPSVPEFGHRPTALSLWVWRQAPSLSHPLPEVFARSLEQRGGTLPVSTPGCDKILLVGRGKNQGMWPRPCPPEPVPGQCREPAVRCYANRSGRTYSFVRRRNRSMGCTTIPLRCGRAAARPLSRLCMKRAPLAHGQAPQIRGHPLAGEHEHRDPDVGAPGLLANLVDALDRLQDVAVDVPAVGLRAEVDGRRPGRGLGIARGGERPEVVRGQQLTARAQHQVDEVRVEDVEQALSPTAMFRLLKPLRDCW